MFALQDSLRTYLLAGFTSFLFFAIQSILLLALDVTTSYFQAQLIIAIGLFGLLLGTIGAVHMPNPICTLWVSRCVSFLWLLPLFCLGLLLISFSYPLVATVGFMLVFAPLGFILSVLYRFASPWKLYSSELLGAVFGLGYFILAIPYLRSENALVALVCISVLSILVLQWRYLTTSANVLLVAVLLASSTGLLSNIINHHINLALHTVCNREEATAYAQNKVACLNEIGVPYELAISLGSLQNRIDVYRTATDGFFFTAYSGTRNDVMQPFPAESYTQDARVPAGLITDPKTLIIGAGAEGVAKVVKSIGSTDITVVESNPAVLDIWNESLPYAAYAHYPLRDTQVVLEDGRLFADRAQSEYDIITMMNTRRSLHAAQFGFPNFLHTKEAFASYYDALTPDGFLAIEEVSYKNEGDEAIARVVATIIAMLEQSGVTDPYQHILMYQWVGAVKDQPIPTNSELVYSQLLIKKNPWSANDLAAFRDWADWSQQTDQFLKPANMTYYRSVWLPDTGINPNITQSSVLIQPFNDEISQIKILTDSSPFMTSMSLTDRNMVYWFFSISAVLLGIFLLWCRRHSISSEKRWLSYFSLIGVGYMAIEMFLLLWLQLYLGSIFITLVIVIGGLFASSAVASYCYQRMNFSLRNLTLRLAATLFVLVAVFFVPWAIDTFLARLLFSLVTIISIGVLLAPFFPFGMQVAEVQSVQHAPVWFGINAIALAVSVPLSILVVSYTSFQVLIAIGIIAYVVALVALPKKYL